MGSGDLGKYTALANGLSFPFKINMKVTTK